MNYLRIGLPSPDLIPAKSSFLFSTSLFFQVTSFTSRLIPFSILIFIIGFMPIISNAQFTKLLDFGNTDKGSLPYSSLISDGTFLYGTTSEGGIGKQGTIYKIKPDGSGFITLYNFDGSTGSNPIGDLFTDGTFLYGMAKSGGLNSQGTIFKLKTDGTGFSTLLDFSYVATGAYPNGSLIFDGTFLYGMTTQGGSKFYGTVFKIKTDGTGYSKLLEFDYATNGGYPYGSLLSDGTYLYGMTTLDGLSDFGTIFKVKTDGTGYLKLLTFNSSVTGSLPWGSLISDGTFLYGTTLSGGSNNGGTIFKIMPDGTGFTKLLNFVNSPTGTVPRGSLIYDGTFLYGVTSQGGANFNGTIYKIKTDGTGFVKLLDSDESINGPNPTGTLTKQGVSLYGVRSSGGSGFGLIYKIDTDGSGYSKLFQFEIEGNKPSGSLIYDGSYLIGTTTVGGSNNVGTIYKVKPDGTGFIRLLDFDGALKGSRPTGSLVSDGTYLYGMTAQGGINDAGTVFKVKPDGTSFVKLLDLDYSIVGGNPIGSLLLDGTFLYGMAKAGPTSYGTIFKIKTDGTSFLKLLNFDYTNHGAYPYGTLISDGTFLYGTTYQGGSNGGWGTLFKIKSDGSGFVKLHDFDYTNGANPQGNLFSDGTFLYGLTSNGSNSNGTLFKIKLDGTGFSTLLDFDGTNGSIPSDAIISDGSYLYGATRYGGIGQGTLFKIKPDGTGYFKLQDFSDGQNPVGALISDGTFLYGLTEGGGSYGLGTLFKRSLASFTSISNFTPTEGVEGMLVTINGIDFDPVPANNLIDFNGTPAAPVSATQNSITAFVPVGASSGPISVTANGTAISSTEFTVASEVQMTNDLVKNCNVPFSPPSIAYIQSHGYASVIETFLPVNPSDKVKISFSTFTLIGDYIEVYDGPDAGSPLLTTLTGSALPADIVATGTGGELTFIYVWQDGSTDWSADITCLTGGSSINITLQPTFTYACEGSTATFATNAIGTTNIAYRWQKFDGTNFVDLNNSGGYSGAETKILSINTVTTSFDGNGSYRCKVSGDLATDAFTDEAQLTINGLPSPPDVTGAYACIAPASITLMAAGASDGNYNWYDVPTGGIGLGTNGSFTTPPITASTTYYVSLRDTFCESERVPVTATISALSKPTINANQPIVNGAITSCSTTNLTLTAPTGFTAYTWSNGDITQQLVVSTSAIYSVTVTDAGGCLSPSSDAITITIVPAPCNNQPPVINATPLNTVIGGKVVINLLDIISDADNNLVLSSFIITQQPTSSAAAVITNSSLEINYAGLGFTGMDQLTIQACDLFNACTQQQLDIDVVGDIEIFNAVSPNNDGKNDTFIIANIDKLPETQKNTVSIYNRWGSKVFEVDDYNNSTNVFKGLNDSGNELPSGTYFYKIQFLSPQTVPRKTLGYLVIKR
jgi:gliding motility-associated-like protein